MGEEPDDPEQLFVAQYDPVAKETSAWVYVDELLTLRLYRTPNHPKHEALLPEEDRGLLIFDTCTGEST